MATEQQNNYQSHEKYQVVHVQGVAIKKTPCTKCIIVAVVLNFPVIFSGTVP